MVQAVGEGRLVVPVGLVEVFLGEVDGAEVCVPKGQALALFGHDVRADGGVPPFHAVSLGGQGALAVGAIELVVADEVGLGGVLLELEADAVVAFRTANAVDDGVVDVLGDVALEVVGEEESVGGLSSGRGLAHAGFLASAHVEPIALALDLVVLLLVHAVEDGLEVAHWIWGWIGWIGKPIVDRVDAGGADVADDDRQAQGAGLVLDRADELEAHGAALLVIGGIEGGGIPGHHGVQGQAKGGAADVGHQGAPVVVGGAVLQFVESAWVALFIEHFDVVAALDGQRPAEIVVVDASLDAWLDHEVGRARAVVLVRLVGEGIGVAVWGGEIAAEVLGRVVVAVELLRGEIIRVVEGDAVWGVVGGGRGRSDHDGLDRVVVADGLDDLVEGELLRAHNVSVDGLFGRAGDDADAEGAVVDAFDFVAVDLDVLGVGLDAPGVDFRDGDVLFEVDGGVHLDLAWHLAIDDDTSSNSRGRFRRSRFFRCGCGRGVLFVSTRASDHGSGAR